MNLCGLFLPKLHHFLPENVDIFLEATASIQDLKCTGTLFRKNLQLKDIY